IGLRIVSGLFRLLGLRPHQERPALDPDLAALLVRKTRVAGLAQRLADLDADLLRHDRSILVEDGEGLGQGLLVAGPRRRVAAIRQDVAEDPPDEAHGARLPGPAAVVTEDFLE